MFRPFGIYLLTVVLKLGAGHGLRFDSSMCFKNPVIERNQARATSTEYHRSPEEEASD
jgi:hypothetical protein